MPGIAIVFFFGCLGFILIFVCYIWGLFQAIEQENRWQLIYFLVAFWLPGYFILKIGAMSKSEKHF